MTDRIAVVVTVSDGVARGTRADDSGDALVEMLLDVGIGVAGRVMVPDEADEIARAVVEACDRADLVLTTGGTGFGPRDVTPEATGSILDRHAPGLVHAMIGRGLETTPMAALSRPAAGSRGRSLVINLPGSPKGATENLEAVLGVIPHALQLLSGDTEHRK